MAFLTDDDYKDQIKDSILATIIENTASIRTKAELKAREQMTSALAMRFDVANIFNQLGEARNHEVIMYMIDMVVYHIHSRISPGQIPTVRNDRYADAMKWLDKVAAGKLEPNLPKPAATGIESKLDVQYGGRAARNPYY